MNGTDRGVKKLDKATEERFYIIDVRPLWEEWATSEDSFNSLIDNLEIRVGSTEYNIVKQLCSVMAEANNIFEDGGILTTDNQIGQRQLLQFVNQTDIDGNQIVYDTKTLKIVIEQLISRVKPMVDMQSQLDSSRSELNKLLEECNA